MFFVALVATAMISALPAQAKGDPAKGQAAATVCAACHGPTGNSVIAMYPNLAHQHPEYIAKQLAEFKSGARVNAIMAPMAAGLTPEAMQDLAAYFSEQKLVIPGAQNLDLAQKGRKLYRGGDASRKLPACASCHLATGAGIPSQYPRLGGQHRDYTIAQLKAFRSGDRANDPNSMMRMIASKLTDQEMTELAEYLAGLH
ncbi:MAG: c-type cytochrome [Betaproteobacteria bacterium]|nr:c-type cytochrome [Betaproteobacteria bacterium]